MNDLSFNSNLKNDFDTVIALATEALKKEGFGILTRIDFDEKIKEKLNQKIARTAILGACNPQFAYTAYLKDPNVLLAVPCNVVVSENGPNDISVRMIKPSAMMNSLQNEELKGFASEADQALERVKKALDSQLS